MNARPTVRKSVEALGFKFASDVKILLGHHAMAIQSGGPTQLVTELKRGRPGIEMAEDVPALRDPARRQEAPD